MVAAVETMIYAGEVPWHGIGTKVDQTMTAVEALEPAGLDWEVSTKIAGYERDGKFVPYEDGTIIVRESDGSALGMASANYAPIQNRTLAELVDAIDGNGARVETAGSLFDGRRVWFSLELDGDPIRFGKDRSVVRKHFLGTTRHDGSGACYLMPTPVRVVCANTLAMALSGREERIAIVHTRGVDNRIAKAVDAIKAISSFYERFEAASKSLEATAYTDEMMRDLCAFLMPAKNEERVAPITANRRDELFSLFENGKGHETIRGTAWAAVNAVAEYADHGRRFRVPQKGGSVLEARANAIWFGSSSEMKTRALGKIREQVAA